MANFIDPDPIFGIPMYRTLWNDDTKKPAGEILICPIGSRWLPQLVFGGVGGRDPFEVAPQGNSVQPGPEYDGVWFLDCSDVSLPEIDILPRDVSNGRLITTRRGSIGYTLVEIIELIKKILGLRIPCTNASVADTVNLVKELKNKLKTIGVTISLPATTEGVRENFCNPRVISHDRLLDEYPQEWRVLLTAIKKSLKEITEKQLELIDLDVVLFPWRHTTMGSGTTPNCKYVFLGYWKRGKDAYPVGTFPDDDPTLIPPAGTPPDKEVTLRRTYGGFYPQKPKGASIGSIVGTEGNDPPVGFRGKAYSFYNPNTRKMERIKQLLDHRSLRLSGRGIKPWVTFRK